MDIHELARQNQQSAWKVLEDTCIIEAWNCNICFENRKKK